MTGYCCTKCEYESITKTVFCPRCGNKAIEEIKVPTEGEVFSYTTIHVAPPEFVHLAPYQVALVQLTNQLKVTALLKERVQIGDCVQLKEVRNHAFIFTPVS